MCIKNPLRKVISIAFSTTDKYVRFLYINFPVRHVQYQFPAKLATVQSSG